MDTVYCETVVATPGGPVDQTGAGTVKPTVTSSTPEMKKTNKNKKKPKKTPFLRLYKYYYILLIYLHKTSLDCIKNSVKTLDFNFFFSYSDIRYEMYINHMAWTLYSPPYRVLLTFIGGG